MRRRKDDLLIAQFAECADMILSGASLAACLERFPEHAAQLEPMLASVVVARQGRAVPLRSADVALTSRAVFMNQAVLIQRSRTATARAIPWWQKVFTIFQAPAYGAPRTQPVALIAILLILFISGIVISGSVTLAADALPGDPLYSVKTATENVRLFLAPDEGARSQLRREFGQRRIDEAQAIVEHRRPVDNLRLQGTIESFDAHQWRVSGLRVMLDARSQVEGAPAIGVKVIEGRVRAPGDGRLVLIYAELEPPPASSQVQELTVLPTASATSAPQPTATATTASTPTPSLTPTRSRLALPGLTPAEPTDEPTARPTSTPTVTRTPTRRPTRTPTATVTRTPTTLPTATWTLEPPRPTPAPFRIIDFITAISGSVWTIGGQQVEVTGSTQITGKAGVGAKVECEGWIRWGTIPLASRITVLAPPEATPEPMEFVGNVEAINRPWWTIGGFRVKEIAGTQVSGDLHVGDRASVRALRQSSGELWAERITLMSSTIVRDEGVIEAYSSSSITIGGVVMIIDSSTQFVGTPAVGRRAQWEALQFSDGSLIARVVVVLEPPPATRTPVPTETPTRVLTATPTPVPPATPNATTTPPANG